MRGGVGKQRVAVGLGFRDGVGTGRRTGARPVLDDDGLPKLDRELLEDNARNDVRRRARTERHDHVQGSGWPVLGTGRGGHQGYSKRGGNEQPMRFHGVTKMSFRSRGRTMNSLRETIPDVQYIIYLVSYAVAA